MTAFRFSPPCCCDEDTGTGTEPPSGTGTEPPPPDTGTATLPDQGLVDCRCCEDQGGQMPLLWRVTILGDVTASSDCPDCPSYSNSVWYIYSDGSPGDNCRRVYVPESLDYCGILYNGSQAFIDLDCSGDRWTFTFADQTFLQIDLEDFDCLGPNTFVPDGSGRCILPSVLIEPV